MSHIGSQPVAVPSGVKVSIGEGNLLSVQGPKGALSARFRPEVSIQMADGSLTVQRASDAAFHKALHGLTRALINNMVQGVTQGYQKELEVVGTGYRVQQAGSRLTLQLGLSHPVDFEVPAGLRATVAGNRLTIAGCDKQQVGQIAAQIRSLRPPERYKGKGVRYVGEVLRLKPGKTAARKQ